MNWLIQITLAIAFLWQITGCTNELEQIEACQQKSSVNNPKCDRLLELVTKLAQKKGSLESLNLSKLNLAGVNLINANLKAVNLEGADLFGSNLQNANLNSADINKTNFSQANLTNADFRSGVLSFSNFTNANLKGAKFGSELWGNDFANANLQRAEIKGTVVSNFIRADLSHANLSGAYVREVSFKQANFTEANLAKTHFASTDLNGASFANSDLTNAEFTVYYGSSSGTTLISTSFENANLRSTFFGSFTNFQDSNLTGANLADAVIIRPENLTPTQIKSACNWELATYNFDSDRNPFVRELPEDSLATQRYIAKLKQDRASDPKQPSDCDRWR